MVTRRRAVQAMAVTAASYNRIWGANGRIGLGVIGTGNRGTGVMKTFLKNEDVEVRALCDVYPARFDQAKTAAPEAKTFTVHQDLLALKEIDAVLIASPDHWHKDHACDAMKAGKDVYVEKPLCRTRDEAPVILEVARATKRVCQVGVQQRSGEVFIEPKEKYIASGAIGKISHIDAVWHSGPARPLPKEPAAKPDNLDWTRFLGTVRYRDWVPGQYLNFRAFLDFNGGKMTDFGHHWLDVVHMYMGEKPPQSAVFAGGIHFDFNDGRTAPDTCNALFEYAGFTVLFQSNCYGVSNEYGLTFHGENGRLFVNRQRWVYTPAGRGAQPVEKKFPVEPTVPHVRNFLDCCKSRQLPNGDIGVARISIIPPLLAVESYQQKRRLAFDVEKLEVSAD